MRRMLIIDADEIPHHTEIEDDERLSITNAGHVKLSGPEGGSSLTKMAPPAVVVYELVEESRAVGFVEPSYEDALRSAFVRGDIDVDEFERRVVVSS